jgi:hypothetical protein
MAEGLVTLTTDLKSLKYSSMPLGSEKPYVTKNIGQSPGSQLGLQATRRVDDLSRISQMLVDKPGLKFIGNQALLQQGDTVKKLQKASSDGLRGIGTQALQIAKDTIIGTAKIVGSTLAQVPVNGTGTHFVYGFRTNTYLQPSGGNTRSAFAQFFGAGGVEGAPLALRGEEITGQVASNFGEKTEEDSFNITRESQYRYDDRVNLPQQDRGAKIQAQIGQPVLVVGEEGARETTATSGSIGVSNQSITGSVAGREVRITPFKEDEGIRKSKDSTEQNIRNAQTGSIISLKRENVDNRETTATPGSIGTSNQDITSNLTNPATNLRLEQPETSKYNSGSTYEEELKGRTLGNTRKSVKRETRINLGDQGAINIDDKYQTARRANNYTVSSSNRDEVDKLNALDIQTRRPDGVNAARDLAKFFFEIITPESSRFLNFRAFITSLDDSYNANWEGKRYVGRADEFYTYGGFSRDINIGFRIAAASRSELRPLYRKMVYLASTTAPTYGEFKFMRGTFVRLSLGSYFNQLPGVLTSVKYTWNTDYPWEIALSEPEGGETGVQELPMIMDCSISFKPIHDFVPQTGLYNYITSQDKQIFFTNGQQV